MLRRPFNLLCAMNLTRWLVQAEQTQAELESVSVGPTATSDGGVPALSQGTSGSSSLVAANSGALQATERQRMLTLSRKASSDLDVLLNSAPSPVTTTASSLLVSGLDVKAILDNGSLTLLQMSHKDLSRCDFTGVTFDGCTASYCDFSRTIMYRTQFFGCVFSHCRFDGAILKHCVVAPPVPSGEGLHGTTTFLNCSFRFSLLDLKSLKLVGRGANVVQGCPPEVFVGCDFDCAEVQKASVNHSPSLTDEDGREIRGLSWERLFPKCVNLHITSIT